MLKYIQARVVILDDKKCGNPKNAIDHIIKQLHICYGVNYPEKRGQVRSQQQISNNEDQIMSDDKASDFDKFNIEIIKDQDSISEDEELFEFDDEEEIKNSEQGERKSSDYVSSLRNPSLGGDNRQSTNNQDSLLMNQTL